MDTLPLTPVGSDALSGRWVAMTRITPNAGPILITNSASRPAALPCSGWANRFCASSITQTMGHSFSDACAAICAGDPLVRAQFPRQGLEPFGAAHHLGAQQVQRLGGVADRLVIDAGHEPVGDALQRVEVTGALELVDPHLGQRVERGGAGQHPDRGCLALPGDGAEQPVAVDQRHLDGPAAHVGAERDRGEHVGLPAAQQRPRRLPRLGDVHPADPQLQPPGVLGGDRLGPHGAERAAEPGGELLPPLGHHRRGHPVGQVDLGPPPGPVLTDRGREHERVAVAEPPVDPGDTQRPEGAGDHVLGWGLHRRREGGGGHDRLVRRAAGAGQQRQRDHGQQDPRPRRGLGEDDQRGHQADRAPEEDQPAGGAGLPPGLVDAQVVGQQPVRGGLVLQLRQVRDVPPGQQLAHGAHDADQRPPGGQHEVGGCADAVVGGGVPVPGGGQPHMLAGRLPGAPVRGDDGLAGCAGRLTGRCTRARPPRRCGSRCRRQLRGAGRPCRPRCRRSVRMSCWVPLLSVE